MNSLDLLNIDGTIKEKVELKRTESGLPFTELVIETEKDFRG